MFYCRFSAANMQSLLLFVKRYIQEKVHEFSSIDKIDKTNKEAEISSSLLTGPTLNGDIYHLV
jgi:hypothetical protein